MELQFFYGQRNEFLNRIMSLNHHSASASTQGDQALYFILSKIPLSHDMFNNKLYFFDEKLQISKHVLTFFSEMQLSSAGSACIS